MDLKKRLGRYEQCSVAGESYQAYIPAKLPFAPPLQLDEQHLNLLEETNRALGRLDGVATLLRDVSLFLYMYIRKEAVLSSQIEGTQSSLSDLLLFEQNAVPGVPLDDVQEVSNYVAALEHGLKRLRDDDFPLSLRLIREIHEVLLAKGRGSTKEPGEFRRSQNWIGGTRPGNAVFVPPPPEHLPELLGNLEKFLHDVPQKTPTLLKAAIVHVQFETIHPFLDGNGRIGRLLITIILCLEGALKEPLLYLSLYFKTHRSEYYDLLQKVRIEGVWEAWFNFFLNGVNETAQTAVETSRRILRLFDEDRQKVQGLGRASANALRLLETMQKRPLASIQDMTKQLEVTPPTARAGFAALEKLGILTEISGKQRRRRFAYKNYIDLLQEGVELI